VGASACGEGRRRRAGQLLDRFDILDDAVWCLRVASELSVEGR